MYPQLTSTLLSSNQVTSVLIMLLCVFLSLLNLNAWLYTAHMQNATIVSD